MRTFVRPEDKENYHIEVDYSYVEIPTNDRIIAGRTKEVNQNLKDLSKEFDWIEDLTEDLFKLIMLTPVPKMLKKSGSGSIWGNFENIYF